jgi:hypothetical protein
MAISKVISSIIAIGLFGAAIADEEARMRIEVATDDSSHDNISIELDSADLGFNLHDMQVGENRSIVDTQGRNILVTREADGYTLDVEGKQIRLPMIHGEHDTIAMRQSDHAENIDVRVLHHADDMASPAKGGPMIFTREPVDEATRQAIQSLLESAGHGSEVNFVDHESAGKGPHRIKVVKQVEVISD